MTHLTHDVPHDIGAHTQLGTADADSTDAHLVARLDREMRVESSSHEEHEDTVAARRPMSTLLAVADTPSDGQAQSASRIVLEGLSRRLVEHMPCPDHGDQRLSDAFRESLEHVESLIVQPGGSPRAETSVALAYVVWPRVYLLHAGRTHLWHVRNGTARRVLAPAPPSLSDADALLRGRMDLQAGDALVLATDGMARHLRSDDITRALRDQQASQQASERLAHLAVARGAEDDVTVVVARFGAQAVSAEPTPPLRVAQARRSRPRVRKRRQPVAAPVQREFARQLARVVEGPNPPRVPVGATMR